jgi:hypothetical protein
MVPGHHPLIKAYATPVPFSLEKKAEDIIMMGSISLVINIL